MLWLGKSEDLRVRKRGKGGRWEKEGRLEGEENWRLWVRKKGKG